MPKKAVAATCKGYRIIHTPVKTKSLVRDFLNPQVCQHVPMLLQGQPGRVALLLLQPGHGAQVNCGGLTVLTNTSCFQQLDPTVTPELCSARRHHPFQGKAIPSAAPGTDLRPLRALLGQQPPLLLAAASQPLGLPGRAVGEEILLPAGAPRGLPTLRLLRRAAGRQRGGEGRESGRQPRHRHSGRRAEPGHPGLQGPFGLPVPRVPRRLPGRLVLRWPPRTPVPGVPALLPQASYRGSPRYLPGPLIGGSPRCLLFPGTTVPPGASRVPPLPRGTSSAPSPRVPPLPPRSPPARPT